MSSVEETTTTCALVPFLFFPGNANAAIDFYSEALNATVPVRMTCKDIPGKETEEEKNQIMHSELHFYGNVINICDEYNVEKNSQGTNVQLSLNMSSVDEMTKVFNNLAVGGEIVIPLAKQFWGATYGKLTDRFGIKWSVQCFN